jgi:hypothetical protein
MKTPPITVHTNNAPPPIEKTQYRFSASQDIPVKFTQKIQFQVEQIMFPIPLRPIPNSDKKVSTISGMIWSNSGI